MRLTGIAFLWAAGQGCWLSTPADRASAQGDASSLDAATPLDSAAGEQALDAALDAAPAFDCLAACGADPPICQDSAIAGGPKCEEKCRGFASNFACCEEEVGTTLIRCMELNPGACESRTEGPCAAEFRNWNYCWNKGPCV